MKLRKWQKFRTGDYVFVSLFFVIIIGLFLVHIPVLNNNLWLADYIIAVMKFLIVFVFIPFTVYDFMARRRKYKTID